MGGRSRRNSRLAWPHRGNGATLSDDGGLAGGGESRPFDEKQWFARIDAWAERTPMTMKRLGGLAIVIGRRCACLVALDAVHALAYPYCRVRTGFGQKGEH